MSICFVSVQHPSLWTLICWKTLDNKLNKQINKHKHRLWTSNVLEINIYKTHLQSFVPFLIPILVIKQTQAYQWIVWHRNIAKVNLTHTLYVFPIELIMIKVYPVCVVYILGTCISVPATKPMFSLANCTVHQLALKTERKLKKISKLQLACLENTSNTVPHTIVHSTTVQILSSYLKRG